MALKLNLQNSETLLMYAFSLTLFASAMFFAFQAKAQFLFHASDSAAAPGYSWYTDPTTGIFRPSGGSIGIGTSGVERLRINSNGIGIGTTSPSAQLEVSGTVKATNVVLINGIKIGSVATTCDSSTEGTLRYSSGIKSLEFCDGTAWKTMTGQDATPDTFSVSAATNQNLNLTITSSSIVISGFESTITVSCGAGCTVSKNSGSFSSTQTIISGDSVQFRVTTGATTSSTNYTVLAGTYSTTWTVSTWGVSGQWTLLGAAGRAGYWNSTPREECVAAGHTTVTDVSNYVNSVNGNATGSDRAGSCVNYTIDQRASGYEFWGYSYCGSPAWAGFYCFQKNF